MNASRLLLLTFAALTAMLALPAHSQSLYEQAATAFSEYDFDRAEELLDKYEAQNRRKKEKPAADIVAHPYINGTTINRVDDLRRRIDLGRNMLERVEQLTIIDTLTVARDDFFSFFRLDPVTGRLTDQEPLDRLGMGDDALAPVYISEGDGLMLWVDNTDDPAIDAGRFVMMQSDLLSDGTREHPRALFDRASIFGDDEPGELYSPFLMADGVTLYFAADGPQSLGGLDIFVTRNNGDNTFLQPANAGMPYNSPANDFMMAIDEATDAGWWASDRDTDEEHVKIYLFKPSELRVNYPSDTDGLARYALLEQFVPAGDALRSEVLTAIRNGATPRERRAPDFAFAMPDGRVVTSVSGFHTPRARQLAEQWIELRRHNESLRSELSTLRAERRLADIAALEAETEQNAAALRRLANEIVLAEE